MPTWIRERVSKSNPFTCVGLDYLGPIQVEEDKCSKENVDRFSAQLFLECLRYLLQEVNHP